MSRRDAVRLARGVLEADVVRAAEAVLEAGDATLVRRLTELAARLVRAPETRARRESAELS